jgi:hypothetical protein
VHGQMGSRLISFLLPACQGASAAEIPRRSHLLGTITLNQPQGFKHRSVRILTPELPPVFAYVGCGCITFAATPR